MSHREYLTGFGQRSSQDSDDSRPLFPQPDDMGSSQQGRSPSPDRREQWNTQVSQELRLLKGITRCNEESENRVSKRKTPNSPTQPGRGIRKIIDLYSDLSVLVDKARAHGARKGYNPQELKEIDRMESKGLTEDEFNQRRKDRQRCYNALNLLNELLPGFEAAAAAAEDMETFCSPTGANDARSDDTGRLKVAIAEWLNSRRECTVRLSAKKKEERGIFHDLTGRLLCPINYKWDDPEVRLKMRDGAPGYNMTSNFFLRCLYEDEDGDSDFPQVGFLKGPLLLCTYRHIFTSPSSAMREDVTETTSRRRDVASTLRLNGRVTARSIAYTATQVIFALNSAREWKKEHAGMHYPLFYNFIVDFFEDPDSDDEDSEERAENQFGIELLQWWNSKIFGTTSNLSGDTLSRQALQTTQQMLQAGRARMNGA